jgi:nucleoside-diphosphate-sugar epimerase
VSERCLLTGASGFIGGHLAARLVSAGYQLRCLVRAGSDTSKLQELGVELTVGDLTDPASLTRAARGCAYVFHSGALVSDWATTEEITAVNVRGTSNLLQAAVDASVRRFIHISTTDVYGYPNANVDESYVAGGFSNWYAQSKLEAETAVTRVQQAGSLQTVILRPATVYGPGSEDVVGEIARAIEGRHMLLIDGGRPLAGLCHVDNLVDAALLALHHDAAPGNAFNVSDGVNISWRRFTNDLADGLGAPPVRWSLPYRLALGIGFTLEHGYRLLRRTTHLSAPPLLSRQAVQVLGRNQEFNSDKLTDLLGWQPRVDYTSGLSETILWLRREQLART